MRLVLINSYKKLSTVTDSDTDTETKKVRTYFRYGIKGYTPQDLTLYKRFRNQDGENYYREENGVPLFHSREFLGDDCGIRGYVREDGRIGFSVETTEVDRLKALAEQYPDMAPQLNRQISTIMLSGKRIDLSAKADNGDDGPPSIASGTGETASAPKADEGTDENEVPF